MPLYVAALNPTDSVTLGFLPAAAALGLDVTLFTDHPEAHAKAYAGHDAAPARIVPCDVRDFRALVAAMAELPRPDAVFSNSDHLQTQAALAAAWFGLPGKDWRATLAAKNKALMRRRLAEAGADVVWHAELPPGRDPASAFAEAPFPCVLKPREGVASEDVYLVADRAELLARCAEIRSRTPEAALVAEEYLPGELRTLETVGDATGRTVLGGFRTRLSPPPTFIEESLVFDPAPPAPLAERVGAQLDALGVGFGACHTEYVAAADGRARLIEVNYRIIGDQCDLLLQDLLGTPLFADVLRVHLGGPRPAAPAGNGRRARIEYVCAEAGGTLAAAPGPGEWTADGVAMTYRPLRDVGAVAPLTGTNRDYLGVLRAIGPTQADADRAVDGFLAAHRWEIRA